MSVEAHGRSERRPSLPQEAKRMWQASPTNLNCSRELPKSQGLPSPPGIPQAGVKICHWCRASCATPIPNSRSRTRVRILAGFAPLEVHGVEWFVGNRRSHRSGCTAARHPANRLAAPCFEQPASSSTWHSRTQQLEPCKLSSRACPR